MNMIEVKNLTKKFGEVTAVDGLTFHVAQGEVFGLLGPNGAGKTTTIRMLCCLISKSNGDAQIGEYSIGGAADSLAIRKMIGLVTGDVGLYEELTAYENLDYYGKLYECPEAQRKERIEYYLTMMDLWDKRNQDISEYSKGMKQKIAIARALIHDPELLFLDEPTANLDPEAARVVRDILLKLKKDGKTIFINTHNLDEAQRLCDRIGILKTKLLAVNTPEQLETTTWGTSKTVFQLEQVNEQILEAVRKLNPKGIELEDNKITLMLADPMKKNPEVVQQIVSAGGRIQYITQLNPSLEETYLKVIQETK